MHLVNVNFPNWWECIIVHDKLLPLSCANQTFIVINNTCQLEKQTLARSLFNFEDKMLCGKDGL